MAVFKRIRRSERSRVTGPLGGGSWMSMKQEIQYVSETQIDFFGMRAPIVQKLQGTLRRLYGGFSLKGSAASMEKKKKDKEAKFLQSAEMELDDLVSSFVAVTRRLIEGASSFPSTSKTSRLEWLRCESYQHFYLIHVTISCS